MNNLYRSLTRNFSGKGIFQLRIAAICILLIAGNTVQAQLGIATVGVPVTQNFDGMGTSATATTPATLPIGFVLDSLTPPNWASGITNTTRAAGTSGAGILTSSSAGGSYNFANGTMGTSTDRSLGFLNSGSYSSPRSILLKIKNNTGGPIGQLAVSFDYEKYRSGKRQFDWTFFHGNTSTPSIAVVAGNQTYAGDLDNTVINNPPTTITKSFNITGLFIPADSVYYLRWTFTGLGGSKNGQAIGIDNFSITASAGSCTLPTQAAITSITNIFPNQLTVNYTRGTGTSLMIVATANDAVLSPLPVNGVSYTANNSFGSGSLIGGGNGYVIHNSNAASGSVTVTGLAPGITYRFYVFEYNSGGPCYLSTNTYLSGTTAATANTLSNDYFQSFNSGNWNDVTTWQSSHTSAAGSWVAADLKPTSTARGIVIQSPHTVTITAAESAALLTINSGGTLTYTNTSAGFPLTIADAGAVDFNISGTYELFGTIPTLSTGVAVTVNSGGLVRVVNNLTPSNSDSFPRTSQVLFKTGSVFSWDTNLSFATSGKYYFQNGAEIPTFRITVSTPVGATEDTYIYGLLEVNAPVTFYNPGKKIFRNGIIGTADLTQDDESGQFIVNGNPATLGGSLGAINLSTAGLDINTGITTMVSNKTINSTLGFGGTLSLNTSGSLYCDSYIVSGSCFFSLASGCTLRLGSSLGISVSGATGNIQNTSSRILSANTNFIYNGTSDQITGLGMPTTLTSLTIANTGAAGNNTVTLSNTNTSTVTLTLASGLFAAGSSQALNIFGGGTVSTTSGNFATGATAGVLNFLGAGVFTGTCSPYDVYISGTGGVNFSGGNITIQPSGSLRIKVNAASLVSNATGLFYGANSSLIYDNLGASAFTVANEWVQNAIYPARGGPYNVTILGPAGNITFNLAGSPRYIAGDLNINNGTTFTLSSNLGGDLYIGGNWTRGATGAFVNNARTVTFNGTATQTVTVTGGGSETFGYLTINKTSGTNLVQAGFPNATSINLVGNPLTSGHSNTLVLTKGNLDINQQIFNFTPGYGIFNNNIQIDGSSPDTFRYINSSNGPGTFAILNNDGSAHSDTIKRASPSGTKRAVLVFGSNVKITIGGVSKVSGINFGFVFTALTNMDGILQINTNGYVTQNAPKYGVGSTLIYNPGGNYGRSDEWNSTVNPGYPYNVTVQNNTTLTLNTNPANADRELGGTLSIANGSELILSNTAVPKKLTIRGDFVLDGKITLPGTLPAFGADIWLTGNWTRSATGVFNPNDRAVYFEGATNSTISASGGETFPYLRLTKSANDKILDLANDISIEKEFSLTTGTFNLKNSNTILKSNATATASMLPITGLITYGGGTGNGRFIVERYIPSHSKAWQFLAVPVNKATDPSGQTIYLGWQEAGSNAPGLGTIVTSNVAGAGFDIVGGVGPSMKTYLPATGGWLGVPNTSGTELYNQKGYMIFVRGDRTVTTVGGGPTATTLRSKGKIMEPGNTAPMTSVGSNKFESVGNPFACAIDFSNTTGVVRGGNMDDVFYLWDPKLGGAFNYGAYQTCTKTGTNYYINPGGGSYGSLNSVQNAIQSGQAFIVHAGAGGGSLDFNENAKITGSSLVTRPSNNNPIRRLNNCMYLISGSSRTLIDGVVDEFDRALSNGIDRMDALKLMNTGENLGIAVEGQVLAVERRGYIRYRDTIFYSIGQLRPGQNYQFEFTPQNISDLAAQGFLVDQFLGTRTPVSMRQNTLVNFTITSNPASYAAGRFMLVFGKGRPNLFSRLEAEKLLEANQVSWTTTDGNGTGTYEIERSADGVNFTTIQHLDANDNETYSWKDENPLPGNNYYRVHLLDKGVTVYSNLAKLAAEEGQVSGMKVYPNPVKNGLLGLQFNAPLSGNYTVKLYNSTGQVVMNRNFNYTAQPVVKENIKISGNPAKGFYKLELIFPDGSSKTTPVIVD